MAGRDDGRIEKLRQGQKQALFCAEKPFCDESILDNAIDAVLSCHGTFFVMVLLPNRDKNYSAGGVR